MKPLNGIKINGCKPTPEKPATENSAPGGNKKVWLNSNGLRMP